jgi:acetylornithine/N-succinyldiaminopimelate aminotransferase
MSKLMNTYPPQPVTFVRGSGTELWDDSGRRYLDFLCGLAVTSLGHAHPVVADAIAAQARTLLHVSNLYGTEPGRDVAATLDRLIASGPGTAGAAREAGTAGAAREAGTAGAAREAGTAGAAREAGRVFFCNSGAEANEAAIKLARKRGGRGKHVVVSAWRSFHGRTLATLHATGQPEKHEVFQPLPEGFRHAAWNDADDFERVLDDQVAAILLEPVQGEGGVNPGDPEFFRAIRRMCDERGIALIVDEVQTGLGRTGEWFGFQHFDVRPDIVTMAKALGNGVPIGACWARDDVADAFKPGDHATTFGGQPLATAAARAVLQVMEDIDAPRLAAKRGQQLCDRLLAVRGVADVRGLGLLLGVELDPGVLGERSAKDIATACLASGLVLNGITDTALRIAPPITVREGELDEGVGILATVLAAGAP